MARLYIVSSSRNLFLRYRVVFIRPDVGHAVAQASEEVGVDAQAFHARSNGRGVFLQIVVLTVRGDELRILVETVGIMTVVNAVPSHNAVVESVVEFRSVLSAGGEFVL